jgi:hypothetical protein
MSDFAEKMATLLRQLEADEINSEQFKVASAALLDAVATSPATPPADPVRLERIEGAAKMLREL